MKGPAIITLVAMLCIAGGIFPTLLGDVNSLNGEHTGVMLGEEAYIVGENDNYYSDYLDHGNIDPDTFSSWYYNEEGVKTELTFSDIDYETGEFNYFIDDSVLYLDGSYNSDEGYFIDQSGNGNHGTPYNGATTGTGVVGDGMAFDGVDDYISNSSFTLSAPYTIVAFVKISSATSGNHVLMSLNDISVVGYPRFIPSYSITGKSLLQLNSNNYRYSTVDIADNDWHHIVFVVPSDAIAADILDTAIYIDGVSDNLGSTFYSVPPITPQGEYSIGYGFYDFADEIRIYDRVLTANEVKALYNLETFNDPLLNNTVIYCSYEYSDTFSPIGSDLFRYGISGIGVILLIVAGIYSTRS